MSDYPDLYDKCEVVFHDPIHTDLAIKLIQRIPEDEMFARISQGVRCWPNIRVPHADGLIAPIVRGNCLCTDYRGSAALHPGWQSKDPKERLPCLNHLVWRELEPGITIGNFLPEFWELDFVKKEIAAVIVSEEDKFKALAAQVPNEDEFLNQKAAAIRIFLLTIAYQLGVKKPEKLPDNILQNIFIINKLSNDDLPDLDKWFAFNKIPDQMETPRPWSVVPKEQYYEYVNHAFATQAPNRVERTVDH
jgi:hypothetical protein